MFKTHFILLFPDFFVMSGADNLTDFFYFVII